MTAFITAVREIWGLFVDDGALALGLLIWCAVAGFLLPRLSLPAGADATVLFLGCLLILVASVAVASRRKRTN